MSDAGLTVDGATRGVGFKFLLAEANGADLRPGFVDAAATDNTAGAGVAVAVLSGDCSVVAERRAARFVGAGGRGMVLKTRCIDGSNNKKAALIPGRLCR